MTAFDKLNRAGKAGVNATLPAPTVPKLDRGLIKIADLVNDLEVIIPTNAEFVDTLSVRLFIGDDPLDPDSVVSEVLQIALPVPDELTLLFKTSKYPANGSDVTVKLDYFLYDAASEDGQTSIDPVQVRFDRRAAGGSQLPPIAFSDDQLSGITVADLNTDGDLEVLVDPYLYAELGDKIQMWLSDSNAQDDTKYLSGSYEVDPASDPTEVKFLTNDFVTAGDGKPLYFAYRVTDYAGNVSPRSFVTRIPVYINLAALDAPLVPEADDGLVTFSDANTHVEVQIPTYDGVADGDMITVIWEGRAQPAVPISNAAGDPVLSVQVPLAEVAAGGYASRSVNVSYNMAHGSDPVVSSPTTTIRVDLSGPGGIVDPDPGTPEHDNLRRAEVRVNQGSSPLNEILPGDFGKDATAVIRRQGEENTLIWQRGDVIQLYWGSTKLPNTKTVDQSNEGANIDYPVPHAGVIETEGVGDIPVYYEITRQLPGDKGPVPVTVKSPVQIVKVASVESLPGGPAALLPGVFPEANANNIITRANGLDGTPFRIPLAGVSNIELVKSPTLSYNFVGIQSGDATVPPTNPPAAPIEATRLKADNVPLTQQHLDQGYFEISMPYAHIRLICRNGATLDYTLANQYGSKAAPQKFVRFALNVAGGSCPVLFGNTAVSSFSRVPVNLPAIAFSDAQRQGISEADLDGGLLNTWVNPYFGGEAGDRIETWLGTSESTDSGQYLKMFVAGDPEQKSLIAFSRRDMLTLGNNRVLFFGYRVTNKEGVQSALSRLVGIEVTVSEE
ncbi:hypothetical protein [Pseudomonas oryziphila]|uniref:Uncharacterized protein n=1 Tax=Pseudomonas entomophila TaxID=312306 RepID=A0A3Q8U3A4_9PSED|nr:hypothetical protein [Pseudomonas oryziphila]AZL70531.1 hypothetical protein EJA05_23600 [Pseudomonas oryziphila]